MIGTDLICSDAAPRVHQGRPVYLSVEEVYEEMGEVPP